jgi:pimeloyl-ACP methyl ester carboxylesterase
MRSVRWWAAAAVGLLLVAAACTSTSPEKSRADTVRSTATNVPFAGCDQIACKGILAGAAYEIQLPQKWNGTLLLFSHGYRSAEPLPPDFAPVQTDAQSAPSAAAAATLLSRGYALAGSASGRNGWATAEGVAAGEQLHDFFARKVGTPDRTYVWGESLGGLVTELLAEKHPDWIAGAAPLCAVLGGTNLNFDLALDLGYGVRTLLDPGFRTSGFASPSDAVTNFERAEKAVVAATRSTAGLGKLLLLGALLDAPTQTQRYDGASLRSKGAALVEGLLTGLVFDTSVRQELERRVGGNPSGNAGANYAARLSPAERALIEAVAAGSPDRNLALLARGGRIQPDPQARAKFAALGTPTGDIKVPTLTLHTEADPLVLVQNEGVFAGKVNASKAKTADLVQLYTKAPATYSKPAPYGAGHCNFTADELTGTVSALDDWVRRGVYPAGPAVTKAFGADRGLDLSYRPGRWPAATS